jgi:chromosome segregation ATPase
MTNTNSETNSNSNSNNGQMTEVIGLLKTLLTQVNVLTSNVEDVKVEVREVKADVHEVKADVQGLKSWANVTDNRLANMENKIVDFATQLNNLDEKVETRLHDTRPIWQTVLARLDQLEAKLEVVKADVASVKQDVGDVKLDVNALKVAQDALRQSQERLEADFQTFRHEVFNRLDKLSDEKHYVDFLTLKSARMQMEINELKAEVAALQQR